MPNAMEKHQDKEIRVLLPHSNEDYGKVLRVHNMLEEQDWRPTMFLKSLSDKDEITDYLSKNEPDCHRDALPYAGTVSNKDIAKSAIEYRYQ